MRNYIFLLLGLLLIYPQVSEAKKKCQFCAPEPEVKTDSNQQQNNAPKLTSIQKQAIQTRTYDTDEITTLRSILSVFQNNMYENVKTDSVMGLITATLPYETITESEEKAGQRMVAGMLFGVFGTAAVGGAETGTVSRSIQATAENIGKNKTSVRLVLKETRQVYKVGVFGGGKSQTIESDLTNQPEVYQNLFQQIDKEIFVRINR